MHYLRTNFHFSSLFVAITYNHWFFFVANFISHVYSVESDDVIVSQSLNEINCVAKRKCNSDDRHCQCILLWAMIFKYKTLYLYILQPQIIKQREHSFCKFATEKEPLIKIKKIKYQNCFYFLHFLVKFSLKWNKHFKIQQFDQLS